MDPHTWPCKSRTTSMNIEIICLKTITWFQGLLSNGNDLFDIISLYFHVLSSSAQLSLKLSLHLSLSSLVSDTKVGNITWVSLNEWLTDKILSNGRLNVHEEHRAHSRRSLIINTIKLHCQYGFPWLSSSVSIIQQVFQTTSYVHTELI